LRTELSDQFGMENCLFAFSYMPEVVAEVTKAGGMGVLGALRFTAEELEEALTWIDSQVDGKPYGVDIVMPASSVSKDKAGDFDPEELLAQLKNMIPQAHRDFVDRVLSDHGVEPLDGESASRELLGWTDTTARPQIEVAFNHPFRLIASALGPPPDDVIAESHSKGIPVAALVGRPDQAVKQREKGVDIIVAQSYEAGGHTGDIGGMVLVPEVVDAVAPAPVLMAGGIGSGRHVAAALALGAQGAWTGSIWLDTVEHQQPEKLTEKIHAATSSDTVRSRALTGKPARQLRTAWTDAWENPENPDPLGMPLQYMLNAEAQERIRRSGKNELIGTPIGQIVGSMNETRTVREVVEGIVAAYDAAVAAISSSGPEKPLALT
jgi:NAD(P)H-dependent flavin oxidoreductase YrpB (nitropropane dioxygenase family)